MRPALSGDSPEPRIATPDLDGFGEAELVDLSDRFAFVLRKLTRMWDGKQHTLVEIAAELGVTKERVRQIQNQGLRLIREVREAERHLRAEPALQGYRSREAVVKGVAVADWSSAAPFTTAPNFVNRVEKRRPATSSPSRSKRRRG